MAIDSWALAVDKQETAVESLDNSLLKEDKLKPDVNNTADKTNANAEKTDEEGNEDSAVQASSISPKYKRTHCL
uniref:Uncharacterized protein n=2 Tax=Sus scrofa TaxID=9823 RepID=A0A4X1TQR7_PIG